MILYDGQFKNYDFNNYHKKRQHRKGKSVKKYLTDKKIDADTRKDLPVVAEETGEVLLIGGVELSQKVKLTEKTRVKGYFKIEKLG
jgi:hypothetical protein